MKEKIVKIFKKIISFSLLDYLLCRKAGSIEKSIDMNEGLIEYHKSLIAEAKQDIIDSDDTIGILQLKIMKLEDKLDLIDKI